MAEPGIVAARAALRILARTTGRFSGVPTEDGRVSATIDSTLRRNPRSGGNLYWASDAGRYRDVWVSTPAIDNERLFRLYFGPWGRGARRSAYVIVFRYGQPQLEVRLSPPRSPKDGSVPIDHKLAFFGKRYNAPSRLRDRALAMARRAGIRVENRRAILGTFNARGGRLTPSPREVLRHILTCGLIKRSLVEAALGGYEPPASRQPVAKQFTKKREKFPRGRRTKMDLVLDQRFEAQGQHNRLINMLQERLAARRYRVESQEPFDLIAKRKGRAVIVEVKAWQADQVVGALRAAVGQLLYYAHFFKRQHGTVPALVAAIPYRPKPELISFIEKTAGIGLVWSIRNRKFNAGKLARHILPGLVE